MQHGTRVVGRRFGFTEPTGLMIGVEVYRSTDNAGIPLYWSAPLACALPHSLALSL